MSLTEGSNSDSLLASELSESDPEMLETSPARKIKDAGKQAEINEQPPQNSVGDFKGTCRVPTTPEMFCQITLHIINRL